AGPPPSLMISVLPSSERPPRAESLKTERSRSEASSGPRHMTPTRSVLRCSSTRPSDEMSRRLSTPADRYTSRCWPDVSPARMSRLPRVGPAVNHTSSPWGDQARPKRLLATFLASTLGCRDTRSRITTLLPDSGAYSTNATYRPVGDTRKCPNDL